MKRILMFAIAGLLIAAIPAMAEHRDWDYTDYYNRDFDRGFFIEVEGWWAAPEGLPNEFATQGDDVHEVDYDGELSPRITLGAHIGERVGTFSLTYWGYDEDESKSLTGGDINSTVFRPEFGTADDVTARENVDTTVIDFAWTKGFGRTRKFDGWWTVGARYWEYEQTLTSTFDDNRSWTGHNDAEAFGLRVGIGGTYWFVPRFALTSGLYGSFLTGDNEASVITEGAGAPNRFEDDDKTFTHLEAELAFLWRAVTGLNFKLGYRYMNFMNAIDLPGGPGQEEDAKFDGPFFSIGFVFGTKKTDTDGDGVLDYLDDCDGTPQGCTVDEHGCPSDFDEDGVCDGVDRCPGTVFGARVDNVGCAIDTDSDGVADGLDLCPNTPFGCRVDKKGCPRDSDGDGVCDGLDHCPDTPRGASVNKIGCAEDSDGDTVPDAKDRCPNTPKGVKVNEWGCEVELVFQNVQFEFDKAEIMPRYQAVLNKVAKALKDNSMLKMRLHGHTDWIYTEDYNLKLSQRRADAVKDYLVKKGVQSARLDTKGHGECCPVAPNTTAEGRFKNRRVEFERVR